MFWFLGDGRITSKCQLCQVVFAIVCVFILDDFVLTCSIILDLSFSPFGSTDFCFMHLNALLLGSFTFKIVTYS